MSSLFAIIQGNLPVVTDTLWSRPTPIEPSSQARGMPVNLTDCTVQLVVQLQPQPQSGVPTSTGFVGTASIVDATGGQVSYTFTGAQTATPGKYFAQWTVIFPNGSQQTFPTAGYIEFEIVSVLPVMGNVLPLASAVEPVRALLGDFGRRGKFRYDTSAVIMVLRSLIRMGELRGYSLSPDQQSITPCIQYPRIFGELCYKAAKKLFAPGAAAYSYRTRALSESFGEQKILLAELENALYDLQNPTMFSSYQTFYSWLGGIVGIDIWTLMAKMKVDSPIAEAEISISGLTISAGASGSGSAGR